MLPIKRAGKVAPKRRDGRVGHSRLYLSPLGPVPATQRGGAPCAPVLAPRPAAEAVGSPGAPGPAPPVKAAPARRGHSAAHPRRLRAAIGCRRGGVGCVWRWGEAAARRGEVRSGAGRAHPRSPAHPCPALRCQARRGAGSRADELCAPLGCALGGGCREPRAVAR